MVTTKDGKDCELPTCEATEKIIFDGSCKDCPEYQRIFEDKKECEMPKCSERERMMPDGTC